MNLAAKEPIVTSPTDDGLPEGWTKTSLGAVVKPSKVRIEPRDCPDAAYLSLEHIEAQTRAIIGRGLGTDVSSMKSVFHAGDVLYGKLRPYLNKVCRPDFDGICSTDILVFPATQAIDSRFLLYYLNCAEVVEYANHHSNGINLPRISFERLAEMEFSLPPLAEQYRIVAKLEELLAAVSTTRARLARVPILLKRFRQSVLAAACSGRLTADWREQNPDVEPATQLLERILIERRENWEAARVGKAGQSKMQGSKHFVDVEVVNIQHHLTFDEGASGSKNEGFQLLSRAGGGVVSGYKEPSAPDISELPELPEGWCWASLSALTSRIGDVDHKMPKAVTDGTPYISTKDFYGTDKIDFARAKMISTVDFIALCRKIRPEKGDILMSRYGTVGEIRTVHTEDQFQASYSIAILKILPLLGQGPFLAILLRSEVMQSQIRRDTRASAQPDLGLDHIRKFVAPLPPLSEQQEIARRVERLFHLADTIEKRTAAATLWADRLTQALLARAFRGELVSTEAELIRAGKRDLKMESLPLRHIHLKQRVHKQSVDGNHYNE